MIHWKDQTIETRIIDKISCDRCGKEITEDDWIEWQEIHQVHFVGGYGSVFGDGAEVTCDLCQQCLKNMIGPYCRYDYQERKEG